MPALPETGRDAKLGDGELFFQRGAVVQAGVIEVFF